MSSECLFWAVKQPVGNPLRKLVLIVLADVCNEKKQCWPSHAYIAKRAECTTRAVINNLVKLEKAGLISIRKQFKDGVQQPNVYTLGPANKGVNEIHPPSASPANKGVNEVQGGVNDIHPGVNEVQGGGERNDRGGVNEVHTDTPIDTPIDTKGKNTRFIPPTVEQVRDYCSQRKNHVDPERFVDHYEANGWVRGKTKIKDWKACVRTWERNSQPVAQDREEIL